MDGRPRVAFKVNELTPDSDVQFDPKVTRSYVTSKRSRRRIWSSPRSRGAASCAASGATTVGHGDAVMYAAPVKKTV